MRTQMKKDKIEEVLEFLDDASQAKKDQLFEFLGGRYGHLKELFEGVFHDGEAMASKAQKQLGKTLHEEEKKLRDVAGQWNRNVSKSPWVFWGSVALGSVVLGLMLGNKK